MENTTITVKEDTRKELMMFKIQSNAKNLDEVIKKVIAKLKEEQEQDNAPALHKEGEEND